MDLLSYVDPEAIKIFFGEAMTAQVTQFTIAFGLAAWIHASRVKREIASQMSGIVTALHEMSNSLNSALQKHGEEIQTVKNDLGAVVARVKKLEQNC